MKRFIWANAAALAVSLWGTSVVSADMIVGSSPADAWRTFPMPLNGYLYNLTNRPFWDNGSGDVNVLPGHQFQAGALNIGNYLGGYSGYGTPITFNPYYQGAYHTISSPHITPDYWGAVGPNSSNFDLGSNFNRGSSSGVINVTFLFAATDYAAYDSIGWYNADSNPNSLETHPITFVNNAATFTPTSNWGFYLVTPIGTFYQKTNITPGAADPSHEHFSMFSPNHTNLGNETYYVGAEDGTSAALENHPEGNGDYTDYVFSFTSTGGGENPPVDTPEPASLSLLAAGTALLLVRRRR